MTDNDCMAEAMYFEARGEGWRGMLAVGVVARNRVRDPAIRALFAAWSTSALGIECVHSRIIAMGYPSGPMINNSGVWRYAWRMP